MKIPGPGVKPTIKEQLQVFKAIAKTDGREVLPTLKMPCRGHRGKDKGVRNREEDQHRPLIIKQLRKEGWRVTRVEPVFSGDFSLGDLWIRNLTAGIAGWGECKSSFGALSDGQKEFKKECEFCRIPYWVLRWDEENKKIIWSKE